MEIVTSSKEKKIKRILKELRIYTPYMRNCCFWKDKNGVYPYSGFLYKFILQNKGDRVKGLREFWNSCGAVARTINDSMHWASTPEGPVFWGNMDDAFWSYCVENKITY